MMSNTHAAIGLLVSLLIVNYFPISPVVFILLFIFGTLLPDIDHKNSTMNRIVPITKIIPIFFKHRGFFHSIFPAAFLYLASLTFGFEQYAIPLALGYITHLLSDCLTQMGCNLLYPLAKFRISGFFQTNGLMEFVFFIAVLLVDAVIIAKKFNLF